VEALLDALTPRVHGLRWVRQVHGRDLIRVASAEGPLAGAACAGYGDGLVTSQVGVGLVVWTADCVPVLMVGNGAVAAVHAGWRGIASGIIRTAFERVVEEGGSGASGLRVAVGPAVGLCHYPVGVEVVAALARSGIDPPLWLDGQRVDLRALVRGQLEALGVGEVELVGGCTSCDPDLASHRRDGSRAGRNLSLVFLVG